MARLPRSDDAYNYGTFYYEVAGLGVTVREGKKKRTYGIGVDLAQARDLPEFKAVAELVTFAAARVTPTRTAETREWLFGPNETSQ